MGKETEQNQILPVGEDKSAWRRRLWKIETGGMGMGLSVFYPTNQSLETDATWSDMGWP